MSASSIKNALNLLNERIDELEGVSINCEERLLGDQIDMFSSGGHANQNAIEKEALAGRLDKTIEAVEGILKEG